MRAQGLGFRAEGLDLATQAACTVGRDVSQGCIYIGLYELQVLQMLKELCRAYKMLRVVFQARGVDLI